MKALVMVSIQRGCNESCRHTVVHTTIIDTVDATTIAADVETAARGLRRDDDDDIISLNACVLPN